MAHKLSERTKASIRLLLAADPADAGLVTTLLAGIPWTGDYTYWANVYLDMMNRRTPLPDKARAKLVAMLLTGEQV